MSKIEILEMAEKAQQDLKRKVDQNVIRLEGEIKATSNKTRA